MTIAPPRSIAALRLHRRPLVLCLAAVLAAPLPALARPALTITVTTCADSGPGSLRDAIATALDGDTIDFDVACSTISLTSGALAIGADVVDLEINGPGRNALTIDGGYADRVLVHGAGASGALTIAGLKLQHGFTAGDGGCLLSDGSVNLSDVEISECGAGVASATGGAH